MTWLKVDDTVTEHPAFAALSPYAWTLWLHGLTYCSRNLTDGHIPRAMLYRLSALENPDAAAEELVEAGRWHVTRDGWDVHDYLDHQRSSAEVEADRAAARERQRQSRAKRKAAKDAESGTVTDASQCDNPVSHGVSHAPVTEQETETDTDSSSSCEDEELAATHLEAHIAHQGDRINSPAAIRRSEFPRMLEAIRDARRAGCDPLEVLEGRWETFPVHESFDPADWARPMVPPMTRPALVGTTERGAPVAEIRSVS